MTCTRSGRDENWGFRKARTSNYSTPFRKGARGFLSLNTDNLSKQSSRDSSTLLGMTGDNNEDNLNNYLIDSGSSPEWQHSKIGEESILPHFVKGVRGFSSLKPKAYFLKTIPSANATDYTERIIATYWKKLWILLESGSNNPIQENTTLRTSWLDIVTTTWSYSAVFSAKTVTNSWIISWTWVILSQSNPTASCKRILESWLWNTNWVYNINPAWINLSVYCDMVTDWGGWTLVMSSWLNNTILEWTINDYNIDLLKNKWIWWKLSDDKINNLYTSQFRVSSDDTRIARWTSITFDKVKLYAKLVNWKRFEYKREWYQTEHIKTSIIYSPIADYSSSQWLRIISPRSTEFAFNHWWSMDVWFRSWTITRFYEPNWCCELSPNIFLWVK